MRLPLGHSYSKLAGYEEAHFSWSIDCNQIQDTSANVSYCACYYSYKSISLDTKLVQSIKHILCIKSALLINYCAVYLEKESVAAERS